MLLIIVLYVHVVALVLWASFVGIICVAIVTSLSIFQFKDEVSHASANILTFKIPGYHIVGPCIKYEKS